ncbi:MAG: hypothetical protein R3208_05610 [Ketobacteraceae bacterium]|nr:hypothetical protein [Ketobacteraceae bacterium]
MKTPNYSTPLASSVTALLGALWLTGCSTNTVLDDDAYRSIGGSAPRPAPPVEKLSDSAGAPGWLSSDQSRSGQPDHVVRYGHEGLIRKIVKTAQIHCQPFRTRIDTDKRSYWGETSGVLSQCTYQFPAHCGAHRFAVIEYDDKLALAYLEKDSPHYVIDLVQGTPAARPGLWDKDDRIGSKANNMGYVLEDNYNQNYRMQEQAPLHLGWIIQASHDDETSHGKKYHQAVADIVGCF